MAQFVYFLWDFFIFVGSFVFIYRTEKSSDQIIKPVNLEALSKWVGNIPTEVVEQMGSIAPMLRTLGYDPEGNPPNYGKPDPRVADNTMHIQQNLEYWRKREEELLRHGPAGAGPKGQNNV